MTSPVTPDEPESARSEDREAAPRRTVRDALIVALSVALHEAADPLCTGLPPYDETAAQASALTEAVMQSQMFAVALDDAARAPAVSTATSSDLSTAWEAAESALPEGWRMWSLTFDQANDEWRALAGQTVDEGANPILAFESGPTKEAALAALTARLQARSTEQGGAATPARDSRSWGSISSRSHGIRSSFTRPMR